MHKLSVIMPVYNESMFDLDESINSILNQTFSDFNLIIIDDNPKDINLKKYLKSRASDDTRIIILFNRINIGPANSRNRGIKNANTPFIALLDADDVSLKNRFENQLRFINKYNLDFTFANGKSIKNNVLSTRSLCFNQKIINNSLLKYILSHYCNISIHSGWMLKREIYLRLHGYRKIQAAEDFDFLLRALVCKYKIGYQPDVLILRRERSNGVSSTNVLNQFISTLCLQNYVKKTHYNRIMPMNYYKNYVNRHIHDNSLSIFKNSLKLGHDVKYHLNLCSLIKFIFASVKSINSIKYVYGSLVHPIIKKKVYKLVLRNNK